MNIFILDYDMQTSVIYHPDKHVVKMPVESTQLLCSAYYFWGEPVPEIAYRPSHLNHPCAIWTRSSLEDWLWLQEFAIKLGEEYTYRYYKIHKSSELAKKLKPPNYLKSKGLLPQMKCVPNDYLKFGIVDSYRAYFIGTKNHLRKYTKRDIPEWWV